MKTQANSYENKSKDELLALLLETEKQLSEKDSVIALKETHLKQNAQTIKQLLETIRLNKHRQFGAKSEKHNPNQLELGVFNEAVELPAEEQVTVEEADAEITIAAHTRTKKKGRKPLPKELPRKQVIHDLNEEDKHCPCGCELSCIGEETTEQLEIIPASVYVVQHIEKKYACKTCEDTVKQAKKPAQPIPKSVAGPNLLAHVLTAKFQYHLPLYRQEQQFQRMGADIARNTLSLWVIRCAELLEPLEKLMQDHILNYDIAYSDESRVQVLKEPGRSPSAQSWMWQFSGGPPTQFAHIYRYDTSRGHEVPLKFFEDFQGILHCDGFSAYDTLANKNKGITLSGCMYHARRKFVEANKGNKKKSGVAYQVLNLIQKLAKLEETAKVLESKQRKQLREEKAKPILEALHALLNEKQAKVPPQSLLGKAISYTLNQWPKLLVYLSDGRIENNNNGSERGFKAFATGRKNWMFCDSVPGAIAAARIYSFIETCKHHNIDPYYWLAYTLKHLPLCHTLDELEALLPYNLPQETFNPKNFMPEL